MFYDFGVLTMTPSVLSTHSSVRWVFVWLILQCSFLLGEGDCNASRIQCGEVLEALGENPHCGKVAWGGANIVLLCQSSSGRMALRMSLLADSSKKEEHVVSIEDVVSAADRSPNFVEHGLIDLLLAGLGAVGREVPVRRLIRESEFDGEAKWRDQFQWRRLVFPPAIPISTCKLCVVLNTPVKVYSWTSLENRALLEAKMYVGVNIMKRVAGSVEDNLVRIPPTNCLVLLIGFHCDLRRMVFNGHLHDAHSGNLLVTMEDAGADFGFRWHDFGESFQFDIKDDQPERLSELHSQVQRFTARVVDAVNQTSPPLADELTQTHLSCLVGFTAKIGFAMECLEHRAFDFATTVVNSRTLKDIEKRSVLEKVSPGFSEGDLNSLWAAYHSGATETQTKPVWVRQLRQDGAGGFNFAGNAFQVKEKDILNIDDLKKAIKKEKPNKVQCDADEIDIYLQQEDGGWTMQTRMGARLRDTEEDSPYGYFLTLMDTFCHKGLAGA